MAGPSSGTIPAIDPRIGTFTDVVVHVRGLFDLGNAELHADKPASALAAYRRALALDPQAVWLLSNAAEALSQLNQVDAAVIWQRRALSIARDAAKVLANLAQALTRLDRPNAGLGKARSAICLEPGLSAAHVNHGLAATTLSRQSYAETFFRRARSIEPASAEAGFALSMVRLKAGDFREGFRLYESRLRLVSMRHAGDRWRVPMWDGRFKPGLRLLIWCEQGFGDSMHFVRYAPIVARRGVQVVLATPPPLGRLFSCLEPEIRICGLDDLPSIDAQVPLMSLPHLLGTEITSIPSEVPYLEPIATNGPGLETQKGSPRIGFAWAGRPDYKLDRIRSITPDLVPPLVAALASSGGSLHSLQVGDRQRDLVGLRQPVLALGDRLRDFAETAAVMAKLDLVVSTDSAVAHLAGALGRPTWVLLPHSSEWRWLEGRNDSPWYPSMRLYRQPRRGDWEAVFSDISRDLAASRLGAP